MSNITVPVPAATLVDGLAGLGIRLVSSVPCTYFSSLLRQLDSSGADGIRHVPAVNEGSATAIAVGSSLAGEPAAVLMQNSGLGHLANPLTSLVLPYRIPLLVLMSMRGWPAEEPGQEQHSWMGQIARPWLDALGIPYWLLEGPDTGTEGQSLEEVLAGAGKALADQKVAFILVPKGAIGDATGTVPKAKRAGPTRGDVVRALLAEVTDERIVATTGYMCRELFSQGDRPGNFYMQGSMGHASGIALGSALARPQERFVVLDGDGAALMHLGVLATIGHFAPANLTHVVFDNGTYESTGGQPTAASSADLRSVAEACGYRSTLSVDSLSDLGPAIRAALRTSGPAMVVVRGGEEPVAGVLPSEDLSPAKIASRFSASLSDGTPA